MSHPGASVASVFAPTMRHRTLLRPELAWARTAATKTVADQVVARRSEGLRPAEGEASLKPSL